MNRLVVLVTGSNGFIGSLVVNQLLQNSNFFVFGISKGENRNPRLSIVRYKKVDLRNLEGLESIVAKISPNIIIHTAAISQVDTCESNPELCDQVNTMATGMLVKCAKEMDAHFIFFSTDFVFNGEHMWEKPMNVPNPISVYAKSKRAAELLVENGGCQWAVIRPVLVYGYSKVAARPNIFTWVFNALKEKTKIKVVTDQFRTPTYVMDVVNLVEIICINRNVGYFHIGGDDVNSVHDFAIQIGKLSNGNVRDVLKSESGNIQGANLRPRISCLKSEGSHATWVIETKGSVEGIKCAIEQISK